MSNKENENLPTYASFMNLDISGCLELSQRSLSNAKSKFKDAEALAEIKSYGSASSLMITSMEESIKSMLLSMEAIGFKFRSNVKGIKSVFTQHGLRYQFAFILSVVNIFAKDLRKITKQIEKREPLSILEMNSDQFLRWGRIKLNLIKREMEWFEKIGFHRERGTYVDVNTGIIDPKNYKKHEYEMIAQRVKGVISIVEFMDFMKLDKESKSEMQNLREKLRTEKWYGFINKLTEKVNKKKKPVFDELKDMLVEVEEMLNDDESVEELVQSIEKARKGVAKVTRRE